MQNKKLINYVLLLLLIIVVNNNCMYAQCNLVVNGDFESYTTCPTGNSQINYATGWDNANASSVVYPTADYFNCSYGGSYGTPGTPPSGTGYIGINVAWSGSSGGSGAEMVGTCVNLKAGNTYTFSFYSKGAANVNNGNQPIYLKGTPGGTFPVASTNYCPNSATTLVTIPKSQVFNTNWTLRSYTFTSPGNFGGIIIGGVCSSSDSYLIFMDDISLTSTTSNSYGSISTTGGTALPCGGGSKNITFSLPGSCNGPYDVTYTVNGTPTTINNINDGHTVALNITGNTTVSLTSVVTASGCSSNPSSTISFTASSTVTANAGPNRTLTCSNPSDPLSGSQSGGTGAITYSWSPSTGLNNAGIAVPTTSATATTNYTLTVSDGAGCSDTDVVTVTVNKTPPSANAGSNVSLDCGTTTGSFTGSGGGAYSWTSPNGTSSSAGFAVDDSDTPGNYILTVTGSNGCTDTDVAVLAINQTDPVANAGADQTSSCATPTVTLNGGSSTGTGISYAWSGPNITGGGSSISATADAVGTYTLIVTGSNFCTDTDQVDVLPDLNVPLASAGSDQILDCNNPSVNIDGTGSDTGGNITGAITTSTTTADLDGSYTITVTNSSNGCSSTDVMNVTQDTVTPVISVTNTSYVVDCNNPTATFDASSSSGAGNVFSWTTGDGNIISGGNTANPVVDESGTYSLSVTSTNGCGNISSSNIVVTVDTISPTMSVSVPDTLTCNVLQVLLDASGSQSGVTYSWSTMDGLISSGSTTDSPTVDNIGSYLLTITAPNGCTATGSTSVVDSEVPFAYIVTNTIEGEVDLTVAFSDTSSGVGLTHFWEFGTDNMDNDTISPTQFTFTNVQEYEVVLTVTDQYGCIATDTIWVNALELSAVAVPNIFTPNGDGSNDLFHVTGGGIKKLDARIMNRWGQLIYEWDSPYGGWDGFSSAGVESSAGTYYYFINVDFNDGHSEEFTGSFRLQR